MRYLYQRGVHSRRRVVHLCGFDTRTGEPSLAALCGSSLPFDTTSNVPFGRPVCKKCIRADA